MVNGIFVEVHPDPQNALCDAATQLSFLEFEDLLNDTSEKGLAP